MQKPEDFTKFYYTKVGLGEACGCAEKVIDVYEFNRTASANQELSTTKQRRTFASALRRLGLLSRPS